MKIESAGAIPFTIPLAAPATFSHAGISAAAGQVAPYKRTRLIECLPEIPESPAGKALRRLLRPPDRLAAEPASASGSGQLTRGQRSLSEA